MSSTPENPTTDPRTRYADLIDRFGVGWEQGKHDQIADLFIADAVFLPDPFASPLTGREAVRAYWSDLPRTQAEVRFKRGEVFTVASWFAVEFRCTFRRRRTGEWVDVRGALFGETSEGLISELRMYWHRTVGGRSSP